MYIVYTTKSFTFKIIFLESSACDTHFIFILVKYILT